MPLFRNVTWLMRRLAVMPPREIAHRLWQAGQSTLDTLAYSATGRYPGLWPIPADRLGFLQQGPPRLFDLPIAASELPIADLLAGRVPVFWTWTDWSPAPAFWHTDCFTGAVWPNGAGARPNHRPGNPHGDARTVWEANRLQHLVSLALIARDMPEHRDRAIHLINDQLLSWIRANPFPSGLNYTSAMEEALRVIAVLHTYDIIRNDVTPELRDAVAAMLCVHGWHIERHLSLYSSAGNHTIAEAVGLLYLGITLSDHPRADRWVTIGRGLLAQEAPRQIREDGGSLEQATWYLLFITDLIGLAAQLLSYAHLMPIGPADAAMTRARHFLASLASSPLTLPRIGDADDGYALSPHLRLSWATETEPATVKVFPATGLTCASFDGHDQLIFLHKDFGMPPNYGHSHSDIMSVTFRWQQQPILVDSGTYLYGGPPDLRRYFRSARAHNTVAVNGHDHAEQAGPFMWRSPSGSDLISTEHGPEFVSVLAARRPATGDYFRHWRGVLYLRSNMLAIWDFLTCTDPPSGKLDLCWHLGLAATHDRTTVSIPLPSGGNVALLVQDLTAETCDVEPSLTSARHSTSYGHLGRRTCATFSRPLWTTTEILTLLVLDERELDKPRLDDWRVRYRRLIGLHGA